jgi:hypothetical protein
MDHEDQTRTTTTPVSPAPPLPIPGSCLPGEGCLSKTPTRPRHEPEAAAGWGPSGVPGRRLRNGPPDPGLLYAP